MRRAALLALLIILFLPAGRSSALSCAEFQTVEQAYDYYDGIVIGQVDKVSRSNDDSSNEIHVTVKRSFKTITERSLILKENITWGRSTDRARLERTTCSILSRRTGSGKIRYVHLLR